MARATGVDQTPVPARGDQLAARALAGADFLRPSIAQPPTDVRGHPRHASVSHRYAAAVANADRDLGLVYDATRKHLGADTLFLFTSDHGAQYPFGKWNVYDAGIRTPLIIAWPGRVKPGAVTDAMVSWVDILPTCLEAVGGTPPVGISGRSFLAVLRGAKGAHRDAVHVTHSGDGDMNVYPLRAVRTRAWKYIRNLDSAAEHHTHIDKGKARSDGPDYWNSWVEKAKTDPAAAAVVHRYHHRPPDELYDLESDPSGTEESRRRTRPRGNPCAAQCRPRFVDGRTRRQGARDRACPPGFSR